MRVVLFSLIAVAAASNSLLGDMPMNATAPSLLEKDAFSTSNPVAKMFLQAATMKQPTELDAPGPAHHRPNRVPTELDAPGPAHHRPSREQTLMKSPEEEAQVIVEDSLPPLEDSQKEVVRDLCGKDADSKCSTAVLAVVPNCHKQAEGKTAKHQIHNFLQCVLTDPSLLTVKLSKDSELVKMRKEHAQLPEQAVLLQDAQKVMCNALKSIKAKGACNARVESDVKACYQSADSVHDLGLCLEKAVSASESVTLLEGEIEESNMHDTQVLPSLAVLKASVKELHCEKVADAQHKADCNARMEKIVTSCYDSCHNDETKLDKVYCFQGCNEASIDEEMGAGQFQAMLQADKPHLDDNYNMGYDLAMKHQQAEIDAGLLDIDGANKEMQAHKQALIQSAKRHAAKLKAAAIAKKNAAYKSKMKLGKTKEYYNYEEPTYDGADAVTMN